MEAADAKNAYRCGNCGGYTLTVTLVEGVTPMFLGCRATEGCPGNAVSLMYSLPPDVAALPVMFEWYRPSLRAAKKLGPEYLDHVYRGGLVLREVAS